MPDHPFRANRLRLALLVAGCVVAAPAWAQVVNEDLKLLPNDGAEFDWFGFSIAIDNGIVAVGVLYDDDNGSKSGSAYLFNASSGAQITKLLATDGRANDLFGRSIAIDNGIVAVGANQDSDNGNASGSAYLFNAFTGAQIVKLLPIDGSANDNFGISIAIDSGIVAIGAPTDSDNGTFSGSAYLFDAATGAQITKLLPIDGAAEDSFGISIALDNGIVAVGANQDDDNGFQSGSAYLFDVSTGIQIAKLLPSDGVKHDSFGWSIAIDNGIVAVGTKWDDDNGFASGSAYLFDAATGAQIFKLLPNDGAESDRFGYSIAIDNGVVAVGADQDEDNGYLSGSAYLFSVSTGAQFAKLLSSDGGVRHRLGTSIAIADGIVATGALVGEGNGILSGSAYVFTVSCPADLTDDGTLDLFDISAFVAAYLAMDPIADFNADGVFDFFDVQVFLTAFAAGCPLGS